MRRLGVAAATILFAALPLSAAPSFAKNSGTFSTFELSATTGVSCPNGNGTCSNVAAEPQIRADRAGNFYASSEDGLGGGTVAFRSADGGQHYTTLISPNAASTAQGQFGPSGGDTDLATAPVANSLGFDNVYVASLSLANVDVSTSTNGGATWTLNPTGASIPVDDREWIAADGASKVCISYHDIATFNIDVNCSYDAGTTFTQLGDAIDSNHVYDIDENEIGNLAIDPNNHNIYQTFSGIAQSDYTSALSCTSSCPGYHVVYMAVSTDGGKTFTDHVVYDNPNTAVSYGHQFVNVSVDSAGNLYSVYSDNHNVYYSFSTDQGQTWSGPYQINTGAAATAIEPWSVAGAPGKLDVVFYGSSYYDGTSVPDSYPSSASWYVYFDQNLNALNPNSGFSQTAATPIIHYGGVCEGGVSCTGNRDLYDDFGVAASPVTGMASIVYSDDQYINDANDPPSSGCTASTSNTGYCDHTSIATQVSGKGIY